MADAWPILTISAWAHAWATSGESLILGSDGPLLTSWVMVVTNITIVLDLYNSHPPVSSTEAFRLLSQGATAVVHGCSVCALDHNLGKSRAFGSWPPPVRGTERKEIHQTSCLNTLLYTSQMIQDGPLLLEGGVQQSWLFSFVHSKLILLETTRTKSKITMTLQ